MPRSEKVLNGREVPGVWLPQHLVQAISEYLLSDIFGFHAWPSPEGDGTNIRYSVCEHSIATGTIPHFMGLQIVFGPQPDILKNRIALIVSDTDVLKNLLGRDWLSSIHFNLYGSASMTSVSEEEIANFKSLRRISANCFQDSGESVHKRLTSLSPNAEIMITSILFDQPGASKYFERHRYRQSAAKRRTRSQPASGKAPHIMKLTLPWGHHLHSCCFENQELHFGTSGHGDIICEKELLWFDNKLRQWWKERNDAEAQLRI